VKPNNKRDCTHCCPINTKRHLFFSLSLRERVRVRGSKLNKLLFYINPHPGLLPEGEGIILL
jgi:hypothetical protein